MKKKYVEGFTLVELIITGIIITILMGLAFFQYTRLIERGQACTARMGLDTMRKAEGIYFSIHSMYTFDSAELAKNVPQVNYLPTIVTMTPETDWTFQISVADDSVFTAVATRQRGKYRISTLILDNTGNMSGSHPTIEGNSW